MANRPAICVALALTTASVARADEVFATREAFYRSAVFQRSGARCGTPDPDPLTLALLAPSDCTGNATVINPAYNDNRTLVIQVVFHVVRNTAGSGNITPSLIQSQIDILNEDFDALPNTPGKLGNNARLQFVLAKFDPTGAPTNGIDVVVNNTYFTEGPSGTSAMKTALHWDTTKYLNVYTNELPMSLLGYATFPFQSAGQPDDGVVLLWNTVGRNAPGGKPYNQGRTATHEVGHYLGLYHTFQTDPPNPNKCPAAASYTTGDLIADTNPHTSPVFGCAASTDCGGAVPIENYMNYTDDTCMTKYSIEQANRIRCSIINYRNVNTAPTAAFTYSAAQAVVTFNNTSTDAESQAALKYTWSFGDSATSTDASPTHTYATEGTYNVRLDVIDPGSGFATVTQMVAVTIPPPMPDAGTGGGGDDTDGGGSGAGCCQTPGGDLGFALCAVPVVIVLRRRRR